MIQFPNDPARPLKASSQRPSSQAHFSTKFIVLGLLGLGLLTPTVKGAPQIGTLHLAPSVGRTCLLVRTIIEQGRAKSPRENNDGHLLDREWRTAEGFPARWVSGATRVALTPTRGRMTRQPHGRSPLDPGGGRRRLRETLSRGSAAGTVFGDQCGCLLAHSGSRMRL